MGEGTEQRGDRIFLTGLVRDVEIGVYPHEHGVTQRLKFDISASIGRLPEGLEDDLRRVVNYEALVEAVDRAAAGPRLQLVESLAERIAAAVLEGRRIGDVRVRVEKLDLLTGGAVLGVEIARGRGGD